MGRSNARLGLPLYLRGKSQPYTILRFFLFVIPTTDKIENFLVSCETNEF